MKKVLQKFVIQTGIEFDRRGLDRLERGVRNAQKSLRSIGTVAISAGVALTGFAAGATQQFRKFELGISRIEGLVGVTGDSLDQVSQAVREVAVETGQALETVNKGAFKTASALFDAELGGIDVSLFKDILRESSRAASAGLGEVNVISDIVTSAVNAYGKEVLSAKEAIDALVETAQVGKLDPEFLAVPMGMALPIASAMKVEFHEVGAAMAAMSKTGTNAETAATQLRALLTAFAKGKDSTDSAAKDMLNSIGLSFAGVRDMLASTGLMETLDEIDSRLRDAGHGHDMAAAWTTIMPNVRAAALVFDLLNENTKQGNIALFDALKDSAGAADGAFEAWNQTLDSSIRTVRNKVSVAFVDLGQEMRGTVERMIEILDTLLDKFLSAPPGVKKFVGSVLVSGPALIALGAALHGVAFALGGLMPVLRAAAGASRALSVALVAGTAKWGIFVGAAKAGLAGLTAFMAANPIGLLIVGITVAVAALIFLIAKYRERIGAFFRGFFGAFAGLGGKIREILQPLGDELGMVWDAIRAVLGWIGDAFRWIIGPVDTSSDTLERWARAGASVAERMITTFTTLLSWWVDMWEKIIQAVRASVDTVWLVVGGIKDAFSAVWDAIVALWEGASLEEAGAKLVDTLVKGITSKAGRVWRSIQRLFGVEVEPQLPQSDAREGPLSHLTRSGAAIPETLAEGVHRGGNALTRATRDTLRGVMDSLPGMSAEIGQLSDLQGMIGNLDMGLPADAGEGGRWGENSLARATRDTLRGVMDGLPGMEIAADIGNLDMGALASEDTREETLAEGIHRGGNALTRATRDVLQDFAGSLPGMGLNAGALPPGLREIMAGLQRSADNLVDGAVPDFGRMIGNLDMGALATRVQAGATPPPVGPPVPPPAVVGTPDSPVSNNRVTVSIENINIETTASQDQIAGTIGSELRREIHRAVAQVDSQIAV